MTRARRQRVDVVGAVDALSGGQVLREGAALVLANKRRPGESKMAAQQRKTDALLAANPLVKASQEIVEAGLAFSELPANATEPPADWIAKLGLAAAARKFRLASACWLPQRDMPGGFSLAQEVLKNDAKLKAAEKEKPRVQLNVAIQVTMPTEYPSIEVDE